MVNENEIQESTTPQNGIVGKRSWLNRRLTGQSGERLAAALDVYWIEIGRLKDRLVHADLAPSQYGLDELGKLLKKSAAALQVNNLELGWGAFSAAQRMETQIYHQLIQQGEFKEMAAGKLQAKAVSVFTEGNRKLGGWRKKTLNALLGKDNRLKSRIKAADLVLAEQILSEHHSNVYRRLNIVRRQFWVLEIIALIALGGWIVSLICLDQPCQNKLLVYDPTLTIQTIIFGVMGACISGILTLANSSTRQNIPEKLLNAWVTFARPLVGAVSALGAVIFLLVGILDLGSQSPGFYLAAAFTAGFSERLLIKTIESVVGKDDDKGEQKNLDTPNVVQ
jgi:hypothetical protein